MNEYYIIWTKNPEGKWIANEITLDAEVVMEFITETTYSQLLIQRIRLEDLTFPG